MIFFLELDQLQEKYTNQEKELQKQYKVETPLWTCCGFTIYDQVPVGLIHVYCIYSINHRGCLINFGNTRVSNYSRVGAYYFPTFSASEDIFREYNKTRDNKFISLQQDKTKCKS